MGLEISGIVDHMGCLIGLQPIYIQQMISHDLECNVFSSFSFSVVKSQKKVVRT
jgi:hypothetical protein